MWQFSQSSNLQMQSCWLSQSLDSSCSTGMKTGSLIFWCWFILLSGKSWAGHVKISTEFDKMTIWYFILRIILFFSLGENTSAHFVLSLGNKENLEEGLNVWGPWKHRWPNSRVIPCVLLGFKTNFHHITSDSGCCLTSLHQDYGPFY